MTEPSEIEQAERRVDARLSYAYRFVPKFLWLAPIFVFAVLGVGCFGVAFLGWGVK